MWPVPSHSTPSLVAPVSSAVFIDPNSFSKAGRKIHVGDCVLFKLPHDSLPFVGIIRRLIADKENLSLSVNWFYRPADIKLGDGALLEAAPNEVFYSFHKDEISAALVLHPCKVSFLHKGVELPSGTSSFVCRRVYDIENKCLWWLTDQKYINSYLTQERQEEVDQLLDKTRVEMHGAVQTGGRSPKPLNGPNGTTQLKPGSDNIQNSSSVPSKSKKREHGVHSLDSVKRERLSKADDDSGQLKPEHVLKTEIAKITDKGGLVDFEGVEKLIQLMQPESAEKKVDLACRVMLVDVISVTDRFDCLGRFVQLRGLLILDEWLQEVHKGKIGDGSPKGSDKSVEEFLFALLRALDRLPVNLHALQTCNVGKSVNHLRSHKNSEIQKKARSLVDTWKKRVEAEMNIIETRSGTRRGGSWPNKSMMPEVSHMGSRRMSGSSEVDAKISISQPSKPQQGKLNSGEAIVKSPESPGSTKLAALSAAATGSSDVPLVTIKEEKSSSSSPSANNSQSYSSDHGKTGASCREDAPSSTSGTLSVNKISTRKSGNAVHGSATPGGQKEGGLGKFSSVNRNFASGKGSPIRATPERPTDSVFADNVNNQRLIVRLPNTVRSPARTASGGSLEDGSNTFGKQDQHDRRTRGKADTPQGNVVLATSTDLRQGKDGLVGSDEAKTGFSGVPCDEPGRDSEIVERSTEASDAALKPGKSYETSYSSVNALAESCAKFSEANLSTPVGDDVGMNLLASVAACEMSRSNVSPAGSPENKRALPEDTCSGNDAKLRQSVEDGCQSEDQKISENLSAKGGSEQPVLLPVSHVSADSKAASFGGEKTGECDTQLESRVVGLPQNRNAGITGPDVKPAVSVEDANALNGCKEGEGVFQSDGRILKAETQLNDESASCSSSEKHEDEKKLVHKQSNMDSDLQTTCGYGGFGQKAEEADEKPNTGSDPSEHAKESIDKNEAIGLGGSDSSDKSRVDLVKEGSPCLKRTDVAEGDGLEEPSSKGLEMPIKLDFDLNEVLPGDDAIQGDVERSSVPGRFSAVHVPSPLPPVNNRPSSITVAAAAKGPFFPSENLLRGKAELGWKGSAATSAFRPAEPRKVIDGPLATSDVPVSNSPTSKQARPLLDFDLNVGVIEDVGQSNAPSRYLDSRNHAPGGGGLDLDLNACEESPDGGLLFSRPAIPQLPPRSLLSSRFSNLEPNHSRGFDLNNGPGGDEIGGDSMSLSRNGMQFLSTVPTVRMNNMDIGNFSSWFPPSSTYPGITIPAVQSYPMVPAASSQRMSTPMTAGTSLNHEIFRGPVLSSSPAVAFPSTTPFQFPGFPFETNFSLPSNTFSAISTAYVGSSGGPLCFPTIPSQLVGPSGVVSTPYRPYVVSLPGGSSNVGPDGRKWGSHGLDLNSGPGGHTDLERRDETLPLGLRQIPLAGSQAVADEQLKMYQQMAAGGGGGVLKRKEPEDGWDADRISYKLPSWQ